MTTVATVGATVVTVRVAVVVPSGAVVPEVGNVDEAEVRLGGGEERTGLVSVTLKTEASDD